LFTVGRDAEVQGERGGRVHGPDHHPGPAGQHTGAGGRAEPVEGAAGGAQQPPLLHGGGECIHGTAQKVGRYRMYRIIYGTRYRRIRTGTYLISCGTVTTILWDTDAETTDAIKH